MKHAALFLSALVVGAIILAFGVFLLIFVHYHERAYIFLGTGAAGLIGGIAGLITLQAKVKTAIFYAMIAISIIGMTVGINYLTYRFIQYQERGYAVILIGALFLIAGVAGVIVAQPRAKLAAFYSALELGIIASIGIAILLIGSHLLTVQQYHKDGYVVIAIGIACFIGGIIGATLTQNRSVSAIVTKRVE